MLGVWGYLEVKLFQEVLKQALLLIAQLGQFIDCRARSDLNASVYSNTAIPRITLRVFKLESLQKFLNPGCNLLLATNKFGELWSSTKLKNPQDVWQKV